MAAYTPPAGINPPFVNLEVHEGQLRVIVRAPIVEGSTYLQGQQAQMTMPLAEAELLLSEALLDVRLARQHG